MKTLLLLAWRNLWRNKKRTLITMGSIYLAVVLAIFTRSMQISMYDKMIEAAATLSTGYIQIHQDGYWDDKTINHSMYLHDSLLHKVEALENVSAAVPRVESFALCSTGPFTKGVAIIGTDPQREDNMTGLSSKVTEGSYFKDSKDEGVIIGEKLAAYLHCDVGDTLVLLGQGFHGITAAGKYPVRSIVKFPMAELNSRVIYMTLPAAQYFFALENQVTSLSIMLHDPDEIDETANTLKSLTGEQYEVMTFAQMNKELLQTIEGDNMGGIIMLAILYMIVGFGVFGTMVMMVLERKKELAVMAAVGMRRGKMVLMILFETVFISLLSVLTGIITAFPILLYLKYHPIPAGDSFADLFEQWGLESAYTFTTSAEIFISQSYVTLIIACLAVVYPIFIIAKLNILKTFRS